MKKGNWLHRWWLWLAVTVVLALTTGMTAFADEEEIVVIYTNDVHCGIEDHIGYSGLALYKKQIQQETPYTILVDAGDSIQGAPIGTLSDGGYIIDIMNQAGYDFAIPGNHEYDYGMGRFLDLSKKLKCGYYSCNFMDLTTGTSVFAPYKLFSMGDKKIAFVGVTTPESLTKSTPKEFQDGNGNYIYGFCEDNTGEKLYEKVQSAVDQARGEGADYVIMVSHLGNGGVTPRWTSDAVIHATNGIDAVIDGHSHETVPMSYVANKDGKRIPSTQTGTKMAAIGKMTIQSDGMILTELVSQVGRDGALQGILYQVKNGDTLSRIAKRELGSYQLWQMIYAANQDRIADPNRLFTGMELVIPSAVSTGEGQKAEDPEMKAFIEGIKNQYNETLKAVLGHSDVELTVNTPEGDRRAIRNQETNAGDFTADAFRVVLGADIGFMNGGGIRAGVSKGDITYNDMLEIFPFGNMGCVAEVTGQQIWDALEMASKNYPEEAGGFLQVSGLTYEIDSSIPSGVTLDDKQNFAGVTGAYRVKNILVDGKPLEEGKTYTLASHNYMLKEGGSGMTMFHGCNIIRDEVMTDVDILSAYVRDYLGGTIGAEYENPAGQGRIVLK